MLQVPPSTPPGKLDDRAAARTAVRAALAQGRQMLSESEVETVLAAYGIPVVESRHCEGDDDAFVAAREIGFPVALKILSPDVTHKSDVGGVALDLADDNAVRAAARAMRERLSALKPGARLVGWTVQAVARRPEAVELIAGSATDPVFGPVILFGQGGIAVEVIADRALALPPLDMTLARDLVARTRAAKLLAGYRNRPAADIDAVCQVLVRISHLVADLPEIAELDINPLLADSAGVIALDARMRAAPAAGLSATDRLAIRPYPDELEKTVDWHGQPLLLRPIRPDDAGAHIAFFKQLDPEDVRLRMFARMRELSPAQLARFTQIDYDREMAFIATRMLSDGTAETLGVARAAADPDNMQAEFAAIVRSDLKGQGLGALLMETLIEYCRARGTRELVGEAFAENSRILGLARSLGFECTPEEGEGLTRLRLPLQLL